MFKTLKLLFNKKNKDIRQRVLFTLGCLFIFIIGKTIPVPGTQGAVSELGLWELYNAISGGGLEQFSIFALGVMPYISATIITSLLQMDIIPYFKELKEQGYVGRQKINNGRNIPQKIHVKGINIKPIFSSKTKLSIKIENIPGITNQSLL